MNQLNTAKRTQIIAALVEGNSINATCRMLEWGNIPYCDSWKMPDAPVLRITMRWCAVLM